MDKYQKILLESNNVDAFWQTGQAKTEITFPVPEHHTRYTTMKQYALTVSNVIPTDGTIIIDDNIAGEFPENDVLRLTANEAKLKEVSSVGQIIQSNTFKGTITAIGGGIVLNVALYIAEKLNKNIILVPTTIIAMSDSSIGGKVRVNKIVDDVFHKHFYKSFYEPNKIVLCPGFLETLSNEQITEGLAEIAKHATYQSEQLRNYLLSDEFQPFNNKESLLKAILWTADLKRVCIEIDPDESKDGSNIILRAAHDLSDKIEENSHFTISHGKAVYMAMKEELQITEKSQLLEKIYKKFRVQELLLK